MGIGARVGKTSSFDARESARRRVARNRVGRPSPRRKILLVLLLSIVPPLLLSCASPTSDSSGDPLDFGTFLKANKANLEAVRTGKISSIYDETRRPNPNPEEREKALERMARQQRERLDDRIEKMPDDRKELLLRNIEERQARMKERLKEEMGSVQEFRLKRTTTFDLQAKRWRREEEPANPEGIVTEFPPNPGATLTSRHMRTITVYEDGKSVMYLPDANRLAPSSRDDDKPASFPLKSECLGVVSPDIIESFKDRPGRGEKGAIDGQDVVVYELADPESGDRMKVYADPAVGHRLRRIEFLVQDRLRRKIGAKDYKEFDGIPVPTRYESASYYDDADGTTMTQRSEQIVSAELNIALAPDAFAIPAQADPRTQGAEDLTKRRRQREPGIPVISPDVLFRRGAPGKPTPTPTEKAQ